MPRLPATRWRVTRQACVGIGITRLPKSGRFVIFGIERRLLLFLQQLYKGLHIGFGLFIGNTPQII